MQPMYFEMTANGNPTTKDFTVPASYNVMSIINATPYNLEIYSDRSETFDDLVTKILKQSTQTIPLPPRQNERTIRIKATDATSQEKIVVIFNPFDLNLKEFIAPLFSNIIGGILAGESLTLGSGEYQIILDTSGSNATIKFLHNGVVFGTIQGTYITDLAIYSILLDTVYGQHFYQKGNTSGYITRRTSRINGYDGTRIPYSEQYPFGVSTGSITPDVSVNVASTIATFGRTGVTFWMQATTTDILTQWEGSYTAIE